MVHCPQHARLHRLCRPAVQACSSFGRGGACHGQRRRRKTINLDFEVGSKVALLSGSFENFTGTIVEIDEENQKLKVSVPLFGRDTIVEVDYEGARKVASDDDDE